MAEDAKRPGGIAVGNIDTINARYKCNRCKLILRDPMQANCGHLYCRGCLELLLETETFCPVCPNDCEDRELDRHSCIPDRAMAREIRKLTVRCPNVGCDRKLSIKELEAHLANCNCRPIKCDWCNKEVASNCLESHKRDECQKRNVQCEFCGESVQHDSMTRHRRDSCVGQTVDCDLCSMRVQDDAEAMRQHKLNDCDWRNGRCPFGCRPSEGETPQLHRDRHQARHADYTLNKLKQLEGQVEETDRQEQSEMAAAGGGGGGRGGGGAAEGQWTSQTIEAFRETQLLDTQLKVAKFGLPFAPPAVKSNDKGAHEFHKSIEVDLVACETLEKKEEEISKTLSSHERQIESFDSKMQAGYILLDSTDQKYSSMLQSMAMKQTRIVDLQRRISMLELGSTDGNLTWKIANYSDRFKDPFEPMLMSPLISAGKFGYRLVAVAYLNGFGSERGRSLSLFCRLVRSDFDATLPWPFELDVKLTLMDQGGSDSRGGVSHYTQTLKPSEMQDKTPFQQPKGQLGEQFGIANFFPKADLENQNKSFLKDDVIFVKVQIQHKTGVF